MSITSGSSTSTAILRAINTVGRALSSKVNRPSWNHSPIVTFNNQNSIIMKMFTVGLWSLFHDNRIFAFKPTSEADDGKPAQDALLDLMTMPKYRSMSIMYLSFRLIDNTAFLLIIILSILNWKVVFPTSEDFALIGVILIELFYDVMMLTHVFWFLQRMSFYIGLLLYVGYYTLIWLKYNAGEIGSLPTTTSSNTDQDTAMRCFGLGLDSDALRANATRMVVTYADFADCMTRASKESQDIQLAIVFAFVTTRLVAFILEECVDLGIDIALHNDLIELQVKRQMTIRERGSIDSGHSFAESADQTQLIEEDATSFNGKLSEAEERIRHRPWYSCKYTDVIGYYDLPTNVHFYGSIWAWRPVSVLGSHREDCPDRNACNRLCNVEENRRIWQTELIPQYWFWILISLPALAAFVVASILFIILCLAACIPYLLMCLWKIAKTGIKKGWRNVDWKAQFAFSNFWEELTYY